MAVGHFTARVLDGGLLELPSEALALGLKSGDEVEVDILESTTFPQAGATLEEALKHFVGSSDYGGVHLSEDTGRKYADLLALEREGLTN
jgi:hypothetical protein